MCKVKKMPVITSHKPLVTFSDVLCCPTKSYKPRGIQFAVRFDKLKQVNLCLLLIKLLKQLIDHVNCCQYIVLMGLLTESTVNLYTVKCFISVIFWFYMIFFLIRLDFNFSGETERNNTLIRGKWMSTGMKRKLGGVYDMNQWHCGYMLHVFL